MKVNDGVLDFGMPKQILNRPQVCASFEQVRGITMPQGVIVLLMICTPRRSAIAITRCSG